MTPLTILRTIFSFL